MLGGAKQASDRNALKGLVGASSTFRTLFSVTLSSPSFTFFSVFLPFWCLEIFFFKRSLGRHTFTCLMFLYLVVCLEAVIDEKPFWVVAAGCVRFCSHICFGWNSC